MSQTERFKGQERPLPDHLHATNVFGVDFVSGYADSTQGLLWVVGKDPDLFDYFLPERWRRTPRQALSETNQTYYTLSKDGINLVWKVSRVGEQPEVSPGNEQGARILDVGYNSPFEEIAYALELARRGMATTYPRAVYMIGLSSGRSHEYVQDNRRYASHKNLHAFNSKPILRKAHPYLTIWGLWNGLDELIAGRDEPYCAGVDLRQAVVKGIVTPEESRAVLEKKRDHLLQVGYEDVGLKPTHILVTVTKSGRVFRDDDGIPSPRLCNFSMIRRIKGHDDWVI